MTEAVKAILEYAFNQLKVDLISAFHFPNNINSKRVIEKCGFEYECTIKQGYKRYDGEIFDTVCYSLLRIEYIKQN